MSTALHYLGVPPVLRVGPLKYVVDGARRRPDEVGQELKDPLPPDILTLKHESRILRHLRHSDRMF